MSYVHFKSPVKWVDQTLHFMLENFTEFHEPDKSLSRSIPNNVQEVM